MHTHCPTCDHCTDFHAVAPDLAVCRACAVQGQECLVHQIPESWTLFLARIFLQNSHESHERHGV